MNVVITSYKVIFLAKSCLGLLSSLTLLVNVLAKRTQIELGVANNGC